MNKSEKSHDIEVSIGFYVYIHETLTDEMFLEIAGAIAKKAKKDFDLSVPQLGWSVSQFGIRTRDDPLGQRGSISCSNNMNQGELFWMEEDCTISDRSELLKEIKS